MTKLEELVARIRARRHRREYWPRASTPPIKPSPIWEGLASGAVRCRNCLVTVPEPCMQRCGEDRWNCMRPRGHGDGNHTVECFNCGATPLAAKEPRF
jgi:hypothetical protein